MISKELQSQIKNLALKFPTEEICGLIVNKNLVFPCLNTQLRKDKYFTINPKDYLKASLKGKITHVFHSHPSNNSEFSEFDKINSENNDLSMVLYCIGNDEFKEYEPKGINPSYIGKEFKIGTNDCLTIVQNYFKQELGININDYFRNENWQKDSPEIYDKNYEREGFVKVIDGEPKFEDLKKFDVLMFDILNKKNTDHIGLYLGKQLFLHHPRKRLSLIEPLDDVYVKKINRVVRHKNFINEN